MEYPIIIAGTTEGRELSETLCEASRPHTVCVASEYGQIMLTPADCLKIHTGRMNEEELAEFLEEERSEHGDVIVIDATHPYARLVTENVRSAAGRLGIPCLRVVRSSDRAFVQEADGSCRSYESLISCAQALSEIDGNILLTTGSKELAAFTAAFGEGDLSRLFVRVLPSAESLALCEAAGIPQKQVIAMHGPFSEEMNLALMRQYRIAHLVTKESGANGGFLQKLTAAEKAGAVFHVIARPVAETGVTAAEAAQRLGVSYPLRVTLIGRGMGDAGSLTVEAKSTLENCDVIFGAARLIADLPAGCEGRIPAYTLYRAEDILAILAEHPEFRRACVLFSGDSGFYSGAASFEKAVRRCAEKAGEEQPNGKTALMERGITVKVLPGISSVSFLAARLGVSYDDAKILSIHGRSENFEMSVREILHSPRAFLLVSGAEDVRRLAERLAMEETMKDPGIMLTAASCLSYPGERIERLTLFEAAQYEAKGPIILYMENQAPLKRALIPVLRDEDFLRDRVPMTKATIRHESIRRLDLRVGDVVYDIGGGTGSVAIETAKLDPSLRVFTIEHKADACALIRANCEKHHASNVTVIEGRAPETFLQEAVRTDTASENSDGNLLPAPDAVFIGGSDGVLEEILRAIARKGADRLKERGIRVVMNAVSLETIAEIMRVLPLFETKDLSLEQLSVSSAKELGRYHLMQAENPVLICSFTMKGVLS